MHAIVLSIFHLICNAFFSLIVVVVVTMAQYIRSHGHVARVVGVCDADEALTHADANIERSHFRQLSAIVRLCGGAAVAQRITFQFIRKGLSPSF